MRTSPLIDRLMEQLSRRSDSMKGAMVVRQKYLGICFMNSIMGYHSKAKIKLNVPSQCPLLAPSTSQVQQCCSHTASLQP